MSHGDFRYPELQSVAELFDFQITLPEAEEDRDTSRPFLIVELEKEDHARHLAKRCILVKYALNYHLVGYALDSSPPRAIYELWAEADTLEELHDENRQNQHLWEHLGDQQSWKFDVTATNHTIPMERQHKVIEEFAYMDYQGPIDMKKASLVLTYFEECEGSSTPMRNEYKRLNQRRAYYGNTTMDAEISLLMANQALAAPGKLVYDPFVGTGSMLYEAILMVGKCVVKSASQYDVLPRILDCCTFDITRSPFRTGGFLDAIISDPPCKSYDEKRLFYSSLEKMEYVLARSDLDGQRCGLWNLALLKKPYELSDLTTDLVLLARHLLRPGGRLVWFLPTVTEEYQDVDIPVCEGMEIIGNSEQNFGKWGRREYPPPSFDPEKRLEELGDPNYPTSAGHKHFREKYFARYS
ncbi:11645_t:CDS:2 [Acaulospora colombiana]|uniref:11645_t:CDS:1 n=1 Tax=Acaulospora colombiana TaxID=27376 RepID=A0ACA9L564_9GLOM|nr:11645_t:CDS:2 [Acaulospora colombiana]